MRKILFLILFFLFSTLSAEVATDKNEPVKAPKFFYFEPAIGIKTGLPNPLGAVVDMNFDFLVHSTETMHNIYLGLDLGSRYNYWEMYEDDTDDNDKKNVLELLIKANAAFDFKRPGPYVDYLTLRLSAGTDLIWWQKYWPNRGEEEKKFFKVSATWEIELDLVFKNNVVLKFAFDSVAGIYPDPVIGLGYRF